MKIDFKGTIDEVISDIELLKECLGFEAGEGDRCINLLQCEKGFKLDVFGDEAEMAYHTQADFNRALTIALHAFKSNTDIHIKQEPCFESCAAMLDVSRGAVLKVGKVKDFLLLIARMGFNRLMLYTEDVYTMKKHPYFGYMRGRYSEAELKEIVSYGNFLGIETIPCIQTLGHLSSALRWRTYEDIKDADAVLLAEEPKTYEFIEDMVKTVKSCFTSSKIHIGMDEAHGVGLGKYLEKYGYKNRFGILVGHLKKVVEICRKYGLEPMMWSDMFFRLASPNGDYYDEEANLPDNVAELIPEGISQVYWDYYHYDEKIYDTLITQHQRMKCPIIFAGGVWTWSGPSINYQKTFASTTPALNVCRTKGIKHVIATLWGDDGSECDVHEALYGLQLFAEYNYNADVTEESLDRIFKICSGYDAGLFKLFDTENFTKDFFYDDNSEYAEPEKYISKQILYQNPLLGLFDRNFENVALREHYEELEKQLVEMEAPKELATLFTCHKQLVMVLKQKCDMGNRIKKAYDADDRVLLLEISRELIALDKNIEQFRKLRIRLWFENNKPFGYEEVNNRLAALSATVRTASERIDDYLSGKIKRMEELEQERLYYNSDERLFVNEPKSQKIMMVRNNSMN